MQFAKEKMNDMASKAKEKKEIRHVVAEEKAEKKAAKSREEKEIAHELSKARQAEAKMEYHLEKAEHRAETLSHRVAGGVNHVSGQSVLNSGGGGGAFYNEQGHPVGGMPARPPGGVVDPMRPQGVGDGAFMNSGLPERQPVGGMPARPGGVVDVGRPQGVADGASMYGVLPEMQPGGGGGGMGNGASMYGDDPTRMTGGAGYSQGRGYEGTVDGASKNNYV